MIKKLCPYCLQSSYSSYDNPEWICPYCGKSIGQKSQVRKDLNSFLLTRTNPKDEGVVEMEKPIEQ